MTGACVDIYFEKLCPLPPPPKRPPVCLFFFVFADRGRLQRVARKLNVALKSFESVFSKFCPRFEASPWVPSNIKVLADVR